MGDDLAADAEAAGGLPAFMRSRYTDVPSVSYALREGADEIERLRALVPNRTELETLVAIADGVLGNPFFDGPDPDPNDTVAQCFYCHSIATLDVPAVAAGHDDDCAYLLAAGWAVTETGGQ